MTELTRERLQELRRIAEAATPGPWEWDKYLNLFSATGKVVLTEPFSPDNPDVVEARPEDLDYIETFNPETALALLDEIKRLQQKVQRANALAVASEQVLKAWSMGDYLTPFMDDLRNALLDFEGPVASEDGWLEVATDGEEGGATHA